MTKRIGIIYQIIEGVFKDKYALAFNKEQSFQFQQLEKVYVHLFEDSKLKKAYQHPDGKQKAYLIGKTRLKQLQQVNKK
jgi:hypothetical protein